MRCSIWMRPDMINMFKMWPVNNNNHWQQRGPKRTIAKSNRISDFLHNAKKHMNKIINKDTWLSQRKPPSPRTATSGFVTFGKGPPRQPLQHPPYHVWVCYKTRRWGTAYENDLFEMSFWRPDVVDLDVSGVMSFRVWPQPRRRIVCFSDTNSYWFVMQREDVGCVDVDMNVLRQTTYRKSTN